MRYRVAGAAGVGLAALMLSGCLTREETIVVRPDGSAGITYAMEGDEDDFLSGDALVAPPGWEAERGTEVDGSGQRKTTATWKAELRDLNRYPRSFAAAGDPHAGAHLNFETFLVVEDHPGRTVYHFTRRYVGRRAGMYDRMRGSIVPEELQKKAEHDLESLTSEEREKLFDGLARYEAFSILTRARNALGRAVESGALDLSAYSATLGELRAHLEERLTGEYLSSFFTLPEDQQPAEEQRLRKQLRAKVEDLLPARALPKVVFFLDDEEKSFEVTEDLSDDQFALSVELPGVVVAANTESVDESRARWEFEGKDLVEGDLVLTAVSVAQRRP